MEGKAAHELPPAVRSQSVNSFRSAVSAKQASARQRRVTILGNGRVVRMGGLSTKYIRSGFEKNKLYLNGSRMAVHFALLMGLPVSLLGIPISLTPPSFISLVARTPFAMFARLVVWFAVIISMGTYHHEQCQFSHYENCNVAFSEAYAPFVFFVLEALIEAHLSSLENWEQRRRRTKDEWATRLQRLKTRESWGPDSKCCFCCPRRQSRLPMATSASSASSSSSMGGFGAAAAAAAGAPYSQVAGDAGGPPVYESESSDEETQLKGVRDDMNLSTAVRIPFEARAFCALEPTPEDYWRDVQETTVNPIHSGDDGIGVTRRAGAGAGGGVAGRGAGAGFTGVPASKPATRMPVAAASPASNYVLSMASGGSNYLLDDECKRLNNEAFIAGAGEKRFYTVKLSTKMLIRALWAMCSPTAGDTDNDFYLCGIYPVAFRTLWSSVLAFFIASIQALFPPLLRLISIGNICEDELSAANFHICFPHDDPGCGVYDIIEPTVHNVTLCPSVATHLNNATRSSGEVFFGATGRPGTVITVAAALGSFIAAFMLVRKLLRVVAAYTCRYQVMALISSMLRGRQLSLRGFCQRGCITPAPPDAYEKHPMMWARFKLLKRSSEVQIVNAVAFVLTNSSEMFIHTTGQAPLLYMLAFDAVFVVYLTSELFMRDRILLDNLRFMILFETLLLLAFVLSALVYASFANNAQKAHVSILAEQKMSCANELNAERAYRDELQAKNPAPGSPDANRLEVVQRSIKQHTSILKVLENDVEYLSSNTRLTKFMGVTIDAAFLIKLVSVLGAGVAAQVISLFMTKAEFPPSTTQPIPRPSPPPLVP